MNPYLTYLKPIKHSALACAAVIVFVSVPSLLSGQAVSGIVTDYNGYWKTSASAVSATKPDNHHNLLSFTYNNTMYSTGVNDALLTSRGETFVAGQYQALPLQNVNGTPSGNTKIGLGAMADGVYNGAGAAPSRTLGPYLNDGVNGLDLGTCVANLPPGTMFMSVSNIQASKIGDGVPDIVVTQVADPSSSFDSYEFTDINGARIGNPLDIVLNNITPIGNWTADFYEATGATVLSPGFTQTDRAIRLWAADFSAFGLNASNIGNIAYFKITLSGVSDIAFVAYNTSTVTVQQVLDYQSTPGRLRRALAAEELADEMRISPNPARNITTINHPKAGENERIMIYNATGVQMNNVVCAVGSHFTTINVSGWKPGIYHVIFNGRQGKRIEKLLVP